MGSKPIGISASRSSAIMGLNPWQTEFEVWQRMIEEKYPGYNAEHGYEMPEDISDKSAIRWGNAFEDAICELACNARGVHIHEREKLYSYNKYITCHIDGRDYEPNGYLNEFKTTSYFYWKDNFGEPGTDKVPVSYQSQAQHQLLCTGADKVIMSVLVFPKRIEEREESGYIATEGCKIRNSNIVDTNNHYEYIEPISWARTLAQMGYFHQYIIERNEDTQKAMLDYYKEWWEKHIIKKQPPEPSNYKDIQRLWNAPVGTIIATEQLERWCVEYKDCGEELGKKGALHKRREELKVLILKNMRKMDSMTDDDSRDKTILRSQDGRKLLSYSGSRIYT